MTWEIDPPFQPGETWYDGGTIDSSNLGGSQLEGRVYDFPDLDYSVQGAKPLRSNRRVRRMIVRNKSAAAVLPKFLVTLQASGTNYLGRVDGLATTTAQRCFPVDEWLPAAGCPVNDLCYVVVEGPAKVKLPRAGSEFPDDVAVGSVMVSLTAATSGATTAGRAAIAAATASNDIALNFIGWALSAKTTGNTDDDLLIEVAKKF